MHKILHEFLYKMTVQNQGGDDITYIEDAGICHKEGGVNSVVLQL